jgi:fibronectin type 3 domain-containing protein
LKSKLLIALFFLLFVIPLGTAFAYTDGTQPLPGLIQGRTPVSSKGVSNISKINDNDGFSFASFSAYHDFIRWKFDAPQDLNKIYFKSGGAHHFQFYDINMVQIGSDLYVPQADQFSTIFVQGVSYVDYVSDIGGSHTQAEFDVYGGPDTTPPDNVTGLSWTPTNYTSGTLNWTPPGNSDLKGFDVFQGLTKLTAAPLTKITKSFTVTGLSENQTYTFKVVAIDNSGNVNSGSTKDGAGVILPPPDKPTGLQATVGTGKVNLSWLASADPYILRYHIYKDGVYLNTVNSPTTDFVVTGLTNGTAYNFSINAESVGGVSPGSDPVAATPIAPPTGVSAAAGNQLVTLNWDPVPTATSYKIFKDSDLLTTTTAPYAATGLTNGKSYKFQVAAVASQGESDQSAAVTAIPVLAAPTGFSATPGNAIVTLDWNDVGGTTGYKIYQNGSLLTTTTTKPYIVHGLTNGTVYSYQVSAVQSGSESAKTEVMTAKPDNPAVPSGVHAVIGNKSIELHWNPVQNATSYKVYMNGSLLETVTTIPYLVKGLTNGTSYELQVTAINLIGESDLSAAVTATPVNASIPARLAARIADKKVSLTWDPVTPPATKYIILRDGALLAEPTGTSYDDIAVTNGTSYKYEVAAVSGLGTSGNAVVFAKPSASVKDFSGMILPFSVIDMFKTAINYLGIYGKWILIVLGIIFCPLLLAIVSSLLGFDKKTEKKSLDPKERKSRDDRPSRYAGMTKQNWEKFKKEEITRTDKYFEKTNRVYTPPENVKSGREPRKKIEMMASDGRHRKDGTLTVREQEKIRKRMQDHVLRVQKEPRPTRERGR